MFTNNLKKDLQTLAEAQLALELNNWTNVGNQQKEQGSNSSAWGTIFEKDGKIFYLNILSATKALQLLGRSV
jgi:hypothetical protein